MHQEPCGCLFCFHLSHAGHKSKQHREYKGGQLWGQRMARDLKVQRNIAQHGHQTCRGKQPQLGRGCSEPGFVFSSLLFWAAGRFPTLRKSKGMRFAWASLCKMPKYRHFSGLWEAAVQSQPDLQQWLTSHRVGTQPTGLAAAERRRSSQLAPLPAHSRLHGGLVFVHKQKHHSPAVTLKFLPSPSWCQEESNFHCAFQLLEPVSANRWRSDGRKPGVHAWLNQHHGQIMIS